MDGTVPEWMILMIVLEEIRIETRFKMALEACDFSREHYEIIVLKVTFKEKYARVRIESTIIDPDGTR